MFIKIYLYYVGKKSMIRIWMGAQTKLAKSMGPNGIVISQVDIHLLIL